MANLSKVTRDHEEIRRWAEERGGTPSHVKRTGSEEDIGILRIDFPGYSGEGSLEPISWEQFFEKFDERNLALLYQEETAGGERSNFNKIVSAETAENVDTEEHKRRRERSGGRGGAKKKATSASKGGSGSAAGKRAGASSKTASKSAAKKGAKTASKSGSKSAGMSKKAAGKKGAAKKSAAKKGASKKGAAKKSTSNKKSSSKKSASKKSAAGRR